MFGLNRNTDNQHLLHVFRDFYLVTYEAVLNIAHRYLNVDRCSRRLSVRQR